EAAREHLAAAGARGVEAIEGDGALGNTSHAPYDRIILTVASRDIAPAWREQLTADGRLVMPLAIRGPQRCVEFAVAGDHLLSRGVGGCGFIPLRGALAMEPVRVPLDAEGALTIGLPGDVASVSPHSVQGLLEAATIGWPTGVVASTDDVRQGLHLWIAAHDPAVCSLWAEASTRRLPDLFGQADRFRGTLGLLDERALAVLAWREEHLHRGELCVWASPGADSTAERLVRHVQSWAAHERPLDA